MRTRLLLLLLLIATLLLVSVSLLVGPGGVGIRQILAGLSDTQSTILYSLRLPRTLMAIFAGASLGVSGALMQTFFRNPLAEPYITGVSAGGALGAVAGISLGLTGAIPLALSAMAGGGLITAALFLFGLRDRQYSSMAVLLLGMALGTFCGAVVWFLLLRGGPGGTDRALAWLLGRVATVGYEELLPMIPVVVICVALAWRLSPVLDVFLLGEEKAATLGVNIPSARRRIMGLATVLAAVCVAFCGVIAFVGLIVPHIARGIVGGLHHRLLPVCAVGGACLVLAFDIASRSLDPPREIPLTILTSLLGAPFFIAVLLRLRRVAV